MRAIGSRPDSGAPSPIVHGGIHRQRAVLVVRGERKAKDGRSIGEGYDPDHVTGHIANGELTIRLEKAAKA